VNLRSCEPQSIFHQHALTDDYAKELRGRTRPRQAPGNPEADRMIESCRSFRTGNRNFTLDHL
jgi:hypothetical protein